MSVRGVANRVAPLQPTLINDKRSASLAAGSGLPACYRRSRLNNIINDAATTRFVNVGTAIGERHEFNFIERHDCY